MLPGVLPFQELYLAGQDLTPIPYTLSTGYCNKVCTSTSMQEQSIEVTDIKTWPMAPDSALELTARQTGPSLQLHENCHLKSLRKWTYSFL